MTEMVQWLQQEPSLPVLLIFGLLIIIAQVSSKFLDKAKIPSIVTYMLIGLLFGPSVLNILNESLLENLHFLTEATLGFVAFKIGLELDLSDLREKGGGMIFTILFESLLAVAVVATLLYLVTGNLAMSILFGALAPASAPAGTVAVIEQYGAKGKLSKALYTVVGFDDALGVIIFGVVLAIGKGMITQEADETVIHTLIEPFREIGLSIIVGALLAVLFIQVARLIKDKLALTFGFILLGVGISILFDLSEILSCMILGMVIGNSKRHQSLREIEEEEVGIILPLFFILFFALAGANLHLEALNQLGMLGVTYIIGRSLGLFSGAYLGASMGGLSQKVRNYLGFGILSQAGVAIGLALVLKQNLSNLGPVVNEAQNLTLGDEIGQTIFTTITVTTFFFELLGPVLAKYGLEKAGEIQEEG